MANSSPIELKKLPSNKIKYAQKYFDSSNIQTYKQKLLKFRHQYITYMQKNLIMKIAKSVVEHSEINHLDIATGSGRILSQLDDCFDLNIGLDTSRQMLELARSETKVSRFLRGDSESLPFRSNLFSILTCFRLYINLDKTVRKKFLFECRRVLKDQGILVVDNHFNRISLTGLSGSLRCRLSTNRNNAFKSYSLIMPFKFDHEIQSAGYVPIARLYTFFPSISKLTFLPKSLKIATDACLSRLPIIRSFADLIIIIGQNK